MKQLLIIIFGLFGVAYGQTTGYFRYDTIRMQKGGGNSELYIENATRGVTGGVLTNQGGGRTAFVVPAAGTTALSSITAATATNTINNAGYLQTWNWNGVLTIGLNMGANPSTTFNGSNLLKLDMTGANSGASHTTVTGLFQNLKTGTSSTNIGGQFTASGGTNNYAILVPPGGGRVGIGTSAPASILHTVGTVRHATLGTASTDTTNYKPVGINSSGDLLPMTAWPGSGGGGSSTWNGIADPTGDQALSFGAGESSTWTNQNTTEDLFTVNSSTMTTSSMLSVNSTSTALAAGNNLAEFVMSGVNGSSGITATGLRVSVTNTHGSSNTNVGLNVTASGAFINYAALFNGGNVGIGTSTPTAKLGIIDATQGPLITLNNGTEPNYIEFSRTGFSDKGSVGALGGFEMNISYNMDYYDGVHRYYDATKGATWMALFDGGWQMQYAPSGSTPDVWNNTGRKLMLYQTYDGHMILNTDATAVAGGGFDAMLTVPRTNASISGVTDLVLEGAKTTGVSGAVYLNAYNTGNVVLASGGGNVAVGTLASAKLHVVSTTEQLRVGYDASNYISTTVGSAGATVTNVIGSSGSFSWTVAGNAALTVTNARFTGINTASPGYTLDVNGNSCVGRAASSVGAGQMYVFDELAGAGGFFGFIKRGSAATGNMGLPANSTEFQSLGGALGFIAFSDYIAFGTTAFATERMRIANAGNVGIGTTSPDASALLDLASTTQGLLFPRMTATQGSAITGVNGLVIYVTNTNGTFTAAGFWGYEGGAWIKL